MRLSFRQIYIEPGVGFAFSHQFQRRLSEEITALVGPSPTFLQMYGTDFRLVFNISAKQGIAMNEVRGPTVFKKTKDVEYTLFLPFDVIASGPQVFESALRFLLGGVCVTLQQLDIDTEQIRDRQESIIESICSDPTMFRHEA